MKQKCHIKQIQWKLGQFSCWFWCFYGSYWQKKRISTSNSSLRWIWSFISSNWLSHLGQERRPSCPWRAAESLRTTPCKLSLFQLSRLKTQEMIPMRGEAIFQANNILSRNGTGNNVRHLSWGRSDNSLLIIYWITISNRIMTQWLTRHMASNLSRENLAQYQQS